MTKKERQEADAALGVGLVLTLFVLSIVVGPWWLAVPTGSVLVIGVLALL